MATATRQPFAPLDGTRLQKLTSIKNKQNAVSPASGSKRKAGDTIDTSDSENLDPVLFAKRSKGTGSPFPAKDALKPSSFLLTNKLSTPIKDVTTLSSSTKTLSSPRRPALQPKSPAAKLNSSIAKSSPLSAPAGRSPTRGKRSGLLSSRRRTAGPYSRVDPPSFQLSSTTSSTPAPFTLDAALKGTIPSYAARSSASTVSAAALVSKSRKADDCLARDLHEPEMKASWFFDIHEDTQEQEMTNLLQHSTCVLDISSDEESEKKETRECAEGRDKENVPPADDVSQTATATGRSARRIRDEDDMMVEKERSALGEMDVVAFYAAGCDESSVIIVPGDEEAADEQKVDGHQLGRESDVEAGSAFEFAPALKFQASRPVVNAKTIVDNLMGKSEESASNARVLEPLDGTGESFELWESGSAKDDTEAC